MIPTLADLIPGVPPLDMHSIFVALAFGAAAIFFVIEKRRRNFTDHRMAYAVAGAVLGAALFSRLGTWLQNFDFSSNLSLTDQLLYGNASILSALVGAWAGVHVAKWISGYRERTGDVFAPAIAFAMVIGRIGCLLTERPGTPTGGDWGIVLDAETAARLGSPTGVGLHPSFVYEIAFHLVAFCLLWFWLRHRDIAAGETLTFYIAAYGVFRFFIEFVRGNDIFIWGLTRPQLFLAFTIPLLLARIIYKARNGGFRGAKSNRVAHAVRRDRRSFFHSSSVM